MNRIRLIKAIVFLLLLAHISQAQGFLRAEGKEILNENGEPYILKGMGLGGWMLQEGYMLQTAGFASAQFQIRNKIEELIGEADTELFYENWRANHVRKIDIDSLKSWGFNSVRLPMHYNLFTLPIEDEPVAGEQTWLTTGFEMTDSLISWCAQNEMYVILDLHAAPGGQGMDMAISDYDPSKPSLWESEDNRDKTVALWKRLAERYVNEPWVGGYDLLNETNWNMSGNIPLRDLYYEITDSIRAVDNNHIIFIEGNWFANDFTNLTPPWDDNIVYSPHKYWSVNDQASIQWVINIREQHNVPIYFGETGENSNVWFRDAVNLFDEHNMGWAWWPMKKIDDIAGPLAITKSDDYNTLLEYWSGNGTQPSAAFAKATLMQLTEDLKLENCKYQRDVVDGLFRQTTTDEAIPFTTSHNVPGVIYATDFDLGPNGSAYLDNEVANYLVTTGSFTAWNNGWSYRNDGVDIEKSIDNVNSNGHNVGWLGAGEWMKYDITPDETAVYSVEMRVAANGTDGKFHFRVDGSEVTPITSVPTTGGWQNWQTITVPNVILNENDSKFEFHVNADGFNLSSFEFIETGSTTSIPTQFVSAFTVDESTVQLNLNKTLASPIPASPSGFQLFVNNSSIPITDAVLNPDNPRIITFTVDHSFRSSEDVRISYTGSGVDATDGTDLTNFSLQVVRNTISIVSPVPGRVEAEDFFEQTGISLENTTDVGGGQNIGFLDPGDFLDYYIDVDQTATYTVDYRTAAESEMGAVQMQLIDNNGGVTILHDITFPSTGGWQDWTTTSTTALLPEGQQQIRIVITEPLFNINWFEFTFLTSTEELTQVKDFKLYPNPSNGIFEIQADLEENQKATIEVYNVLGKRVFVRNLEPSVKINENFDLEHLGSGTFFLKMSLENGAFANKKIFILSKD